MNQEVVYDNADFDVSIGSLNLPTTTKSIKCKVVNNDPYYNVESPTDPLQLSFRDALEEEEEYRPTGKAAAVAD